MKKQNFLDAGVLDVQIIGLSKAPSFIWNIDEKKILSGLDETMIIVNGIMVPKPGNRVANVMSFTEIDEFLLNVINNESEGIIIYEDSTNFRFVFIGENMYNLEHAVRNRYKNAFVV